MMQAKVYSPTLDQHEQAAELTKGRRARSALTQTAVFILLFGTYKFWISGFSFPVQLNVTDFIVAVAITAGTQAYSYFDRKSVAKSAAQTQKWDADDLGTQYYLADTRGLKWWWDGQHGSVPWDYFDAYRLTDDALIVATSPSGSYWIMPRSDLGAGLTANIVQLLEKNGARESPN